MATVYRNLQEQVYENAKDIEELQNKESTIDEKIISVTTPIIDEKIMEKKSLYTQKSSIEVQDTGVDGTIVFSTINTYNDDNLTKHRYIRFKGEYFDYIFGETQNPFKIKLPTKSGTLALVEDIPVNTGYIKAHTIENDAEKNYTTKIDLGSGNSGSTLHLEAPGDNGIGSIDIANEYVQGSTSIKFTADKLVFGNTEITEQQLQKLLQLIQNQ